MIIMGYYYTTTIIHNLHVSKNLTSLPGNSASVVEILIGRFELFSLSTHLAERFVSNVFRRST